LANVMRMPSHAAMLMAIGTIDASGNDAAING
jgi:hypothetical protein